jgi:hypothetical protein
MKQLKKSSIGARKSKQDLQQELTKADEVLKRQKAQLEECVNELQHIKDQLGSIEELQAKLNSAEKQLERLKELEKNNDELKKQSKKAEMDASSRIEKLKKELEASQKERSDLLEKTEKLEKTIDSLQELAKVEEDHEKVISESIPASRASFRIDIYPYQGHYQGKILHLLSKDKRPLKGLDEKTIKEFISLHLPRLDEDPKKVRFTEIPKISELKMIQANKVLPGGTLYNDQPLEIQADFNLVGFDLTEKGPMEHEIIVYANSLEGNPRHTVAEAQGTITSVEESSVKMMGRIPPQGTYRLEAFVTLSSSKVIPHQKPIRSFFRGSLFHVY